MIFIKYSVQSAKQGCNARSVLSLGGNVNTRRMKKPDIGLIFHIENE